MKGGLWGGLIGLVVMFLSLAALPVQAWEGRSAVERAAFVRTHACPQEKAHRPTACPGYVVDHIVPLCAGGADLRTNMQWQGNRDAVYKDREETRLCALIRGGAAKKGLPAQSYCAIMPIARYPRMRRDFKCIP